MMSAEICQSNLNWLTRQQIAAYLNLQQTLPLIKNRASGFLVKVSPIFTLFKLCVWSPPAPEGNILCYSC